MGVLGYKQFHSPNAFLTVDFRLHPTQPYRGIDPSVIVHPEALKRTGEGCFH